MANKSKALEATSTFRDAGILAPATALVGSIGPSQAQVLDETGGAPPAVVAPAVPLRPLPATVSVNFEQSRGTLLRTERYNNLTRANRYVSQRESEMLVEYLDQLGAVRALQGASLARSADALIALNNVNASILAYGADLVTGKDLQFGGLVSFDIPEVLQEDTCLSMARLLVAAAHRAVHELIESICSNNQLYVFHHHAVFYDISQHMTRLISEAWVANSEALLHEDHPHAVSVREMHASEQVHG